MKFVAWRRFSHQIGWCDVSCLLFYVTLCIIPHLMEKFSIRFDWYILHFRWVRQKCQLPVACLPYRVISVPRKTGQKWGVLEKHPASASCKASPLITSPPEFCTTRAQSFSYFCLTYPARKSKKSKECITGDLDSLLWESDDLSDDWRARFGQYCRYFDKNKTKEIKITSDEENWLC